VDLLICNALVRDGEPLVDIAISNGRIATIDRHIDAASAVVIDAGGRVVCPALLEPHVHLDKALLGTPNHSGTLTEAIRATGAAKQTQSRDEMLARSRRLLEMAIRSGTVALRCHPDVDPIQGLAGVETALALKEEYADLIALQVVAFPQEGLLKSPGTLDLMNEALTMGADVVGGCPYNEAGRDETYEHIRLVFDLADRFGRPVDLHADFADSAADPRFSTAAHIAQTAIDRSYRGRVALGHATSLSAMAPDEARPVIELLAEADVSIVTLPATDLYLGGRAETGFNPRRGLAPVRALSAAGVNVAFSSNNIRNAFTPFGNADPIQIGSLLAHAGQLGSPADRQLVLDMCTYRAARAMGIADDYGIAVGNCADLIVFDTFCVADVLLDIPPRLFVVKHGRVTVETRVECRVHRAFAAELAS
jgi:cytosine deaminase